MSEVTIRKYKSGDLPEMIAVWNEVVEGGVAFPQEEMLDSVGGEKFFAAQTYCGVAEVDEKVLGLYILHPNNIGRCGHICNASYAVSSKSRGQHIGEKLVLDCIHQAHEEGFRVLQFNAVVRTNIHARHLYELSVSEVVGEDRTMGCTVAWGATLHGKGVSELTSEPDSMSFGLGRMNGQKDDKLMQVKALLEKMCPVEVEDNFMGVRWSKLLINAAFSGMSAVIGGTFGDAAENKISRVCCQNLIKECIDVAAAAGIKIEPVQGKDIVKLLDYKGNGIKKKISFALIPICIKKHRLLKASMLQDLEKGKK